MKKLNNYLSNIMFIETLDNIYFEVESQEINESLNCDCLKQLAKQLADQKKKDKENKNWHLSNNFKEIFGRRWGSKNIMWDKITDKDIEFIDADEWKVRPGYLKPKIRKIINGKTSDIILLVQNKETKNFDYYVKQRQPIKLTPSWGSRAGDETSGLRQNDIIDNCENKNLYFINIAGKESTELKQERVNQKAGMIYLDENSLERMAQQNRERYKKFIEQNKALSNEDDDLIDKCNKIVEVVSNFISEVAKDPITNADYIYPLNDVANYLYDKRRYVEGRGYRNRGYYSGVDGTIPLLMVYTKAKQDSAARGSSYSAEEYKRAKTGLENAINRIYEIVDKKGLPINLPK